MAWTVYFEPEVEILGFYGGDMEHALSAWTSTSRWLDDEKKARIPALLRQLATAEPVPHGTPFEKSAIHFLVTCDVATHIHLLKHRIGVSINAESARYKELKNDRMYVPDDWPKPLQEQLRDYARQGQFFYHSVMESLVKSFGMDRARAKESARYFLGYNNIITQDVMFNFRSFVHFLTQRNDPHAQLEIQLVAQTMLQQVRETGAFDESLAAFDL